MKLKVEYIDGSIELIKVEDVAILTSLNTLEFVYDNFEKVGGNPLGVISRITVDNEVIYDYLGRKENHKRRCHYDY